ncbi:MAG: thiamine pyrophosphate-dependent enzyme [Gammaproteobacteria bacterium]
MCVDGDGSLAMHLGVMAVTGNRRPANFGHVMFNNRVRGSVGGQPSAHKAADPIGIARAYGYARATSCASIEDLGVLLDVANSSEGLWFIEIQVSTGMLADLPRPDGFNTRMRRLRQSLAN